MFSPLDHLYGDRNETFHERIFPSVMSRLDIPRVLRRHGLTWQEVFATENLRRVDAPAPLLCADRIDYTLRDLARFGHITPQLAALSVASVSLTVSSSSKTESQQPNSPDVPIPCPASVHAPA